MALYQKSQATRKPQITTTTPLCNGSPCFGSFTFADGATVRQSGGLVCSQHGRRHCLHHTAAHAAILAQAASEEAATAAALEAAEAFAADYDAWLDVVDAANPLPTPTTPYAPVLHTFSTTAAGGISQHCALGLHDDCSLLDCGCSCHRLADPIEARERLQCMFGY